MIHNAAGLGADLSALDAVVISHLHPGHVGGPGRQLRRTFGFSRQPMEPRGIPAHVPVPMAHDRAERILTTAPGVIAPGVAVLPPLPRALFWMGPTEEQAMVVNVRGFGLVLLSGCGHPPIERTLAATEWVLDVPVKGLSAPHELLGPVSLPLTRNVRSYMLTWNVVGMLILSDATARGAGYRVPGPGLPQCLCADLAAQWAGGGVHDPALGPADSLTGLRQLPKVDGLPVVVRAPEQPEEG